jgi:hypothetical protein
MSISSMTNVAFARRRDVAPEDKAPGSVEEIAAAKGDPAGVATGSTAALSAIAAYIPTEVLTVYVAVVAALEPAKGQAAVAAGANGAWISFLLFLIATPVVVWLVYAGKVRKAGKRLPTSVKRWPRWEMFAATAAFTAWAFALPETPFTSLAWYSSAIAAVLVLVVTTALGLVAPLVASNLDG